MQIDSYIRKGFKECWCDGSECHISLYPGFDLRNSQFTDEGLIVGNQEVYGNEKENEEGKNSPQ